MSRKQSSRWVESRVFSVTSSARLAGTVAFLCTIMLMALFPAETLWAASGAEVRNVRVWHAPDHTRMVFDVSDSVQQKSFMLDNPARLVLDLKKTRLTSSLRDLDLSKSPILSVRTAPRNKTDLRVVLDLARPVTPEVFVLPPSGNYGHRLVVDLNETAASQRSAKEKVVKKSISLNSGKRDIVVYIDPGHGGEDPGAIGPKGIQEKFVVLAIARELARQINREPGYQAVLTRDGDYYIGLRKRTQIARQGKADMFISIHADAFKKPSAKGASVYALSARGATSETARWLADSENRSDLIGGVGKVSLEGKDDVLAGVLLDLSMTASLKASLSVGQEVLGHVGKVGHLHKRRVEQAGFVVLKSPDIPSILVETGFISNPSEARLLSSRHYQLRMAKAIKTGVIRYFSEHAPPGTLVAWKQEKIRKNLVQKYKIKRGDTLSDIAESNGTTVARLREHNRLQTNRIRVGQIIEIPAS